MIRSLHAFVHKFKTAALNPSYRVSQKKPAPFSIFYYGRNYWRKYLKICHKYIQLINKQFPNFLCPNCNRFFSTSVFPRPLKIEVVRATAWIKWMQIGNFSINYQIIHIQRQNSVKFYNSMDIIFICVRINHPTGFYLDPYPRLFKQSLAWLGTEVRLNFGRSWVRLKPWRGNRRSKHNKWKKYDYWY